MNYDEIVKQAQDSYKSFFKEVNELPTDKDMTDVNLDVNKIKNSIDNAKVQAESHMVQLKKLRNKLENQAAMAEEKVFPAEHQAISAQVDKMYNEYLEAQKRLFMLSAKVARISHNAK